MLNVQDLQVKQQLFKKTKATGTDTDSMLKSVICSGISDSLKHKVDQESLGGYIRSRLLWIDTQNRFPSLREWRVGAVTGTGQCIGQLKEWKSHSLAEAENIQVTENSWNAQHNWEGKEIL